MSTSLVAGPTSMLTSIPETRRRIFESVFPPNVSASVPTPVASPTASFVHQLLPPAPTHGYNTRHHPHPSSSPSSDVGAVSLLPSPATVLARESRAWHLATSFLSFPNNALPATVREWIEARGTPSRDAIEAIRYLVLSNEDGNIVDGRENLMEWYVCEVRRHFLGWVKPSCHIPEVSTIAILFRV
ncbi:hypothetical protein K440DRAFT_297019 [Wilcoxina mikolae CBS 423.85]|nr:hypothetical protein K440DRAFT_297019 [Wilcoxina mikolae CBS 423.85]